MEVRALPPQLKSVRLKREHMFPMGTPGPSYTKGAANRAIAESRSCAEALRRLGLCWTGGSSKTLRKWAVIWGIPTDHFDPYAYLRGARPKTKPLEQLLVENSTYDRGHLKRRLYDEGLKERRCELCGQGEVWRGRRMSLILDHANGVGTDNRVENLRIVCPNCAATLDTHCGRKLRLEPRGCVRCGDFFQPRYSSQRYCCRQCGQRWDCSHLRKPRPDTRKVERPSYEQLQADLAEMSFLAGGRK
jgi:hypothetical protein